MQPALRRQTEGVASVFLYFAGDRLSESELWSARLDGHLVELGEGFVPADTVETSALRAASLAPITGTDAAATHASAAWVHGLIDDPPCRHSIQRITATRTRQRIGRRFVYRDPLVPDRDLWIISGVAVTSPERTLADLARSGEEDAERIVREIARTHPELAAPAREWLRSCARMPNKRRAIGLLEACSSRGDGA